MGQFEQLQDSIQLPSTAGAAVLLDCAKNQSEDLYIVSGFDQVFLWSFESTKTLLPVIEGYPQGITSLVSHSTEDSFFTAMRDNRIIRWHPSHGVEWQTVTKSQATCLSCHPSGKVLAVGAVNGDLMIMSSTEGTQVSLLPISEHSISCLSYSASGSYMAIGSVEGCLYLLPVTDDGLGYHRISVLKVID